jgi:hypothetical protein
MTARALSAARRAVTVRNSAPRIDYIGFSGLPDFAATARQTSDLQNNPTDWAGATFSDACRRAESGDFARVAASDAMLEKVEALLDMSALRTVTVAAVAGGVPCVPAYLAGNPLAMRVRRRVTHDRGEVALFVDAWTSAGADADVITRRGAAVLALARALSTVRPVRILSFALSGKANRKFLYSLPLDSAPLDLARAAWVFSAPEFSRQCRLNIQQDVLDSSDTQRGDFDPLPLLCDLYGVAPESAVKVAGLGASDCGDFESDAAAVAWVEQHLERLTA